MDIEVLKKYWDIEPIEIEPIEIKLITETTWAVGSQYILKVYTNLEQLQTNIQITNALYQEKIPVAVVIQTRDHREYLLIQDRYYVLMRRLVGTHIETLLNEEDGHTAFLLGKTMARLHLAFRRCENKIPHKEHDFYEELAESILNMYEKEEKERLPMDENEVKECMKELKGIYKELPKQIIHRDPHLKNLLFEGDKLTGYLDFDLGQKNIRIFDLCYLSLSILTENWEEEGKEEKWVRIVNELVTGYDTITPLEEKEKQAIPCIMKAIELLFVSYFIHLGKNELAQKSVFAYDWIREQERQLKAVLV